MPRKRYITRSVARTVVAILVATLLLKFFFVTTYYTPRHPREGRGTLYVVSKKGTVSGGEELIYEFEDPSQSFPHRFYALAKCVLAPGEEIDSVFAPFRGQIVLLTPARAKTMGAFLLQECDDSSGRLDSLLSTLPTRYTVRHSYYLCLSPISSSTVTSTERFLWIRQEDVRGRVLTSLPLPF